MQTTSSELAVQRANYSLTASVFVCFVFTSTELQKGKSNVSVALTQIFLTNGQIIPCL